MVSKKLLGIAALAAVVVVGIVVGPSLYKFSVLAAEAVWCDGFDFRCCGEKAESKSWTAAANAWATCPAAATKCTVTSYTEGTLSDIRVGTCRTTTSIIGLPIAECSGTSLGSTPVDVQAGQAIFFFQTQFSSPTGTGSLNYKIYSERLADCGDAACDAGVTGIAVQGASGCQFVTDSRVYDSSGRLLVEPVVGQSKAVTVPVGSCYLVLDSSERHICGSIAERCTTDNDCIAGHTLTYQGYGAECGTGQISMYGCKVYGEQCDAYDELPDGTKKCVGEKVSLSRCGVIKTQQVQCCPYTDACGSGSCDPTSYTCKQPAEVKCSSDWQCGQQKYCDRTKMELQQPKCMNAGLPTSYCTKQAVQKVGCCYDQDCAQGWYCDTNYKCLQAAVPIPECPYECCVNEPSPSGVPYRDKPCAMNQTCKDHVCNGQGTECKTDADCDDDNPWTIDKCEGWWGKSCKHYPLFDVGRIIAIVITATLFGAVAYALSRKKELAIVGAVIGGIMAFWWISLGFWGQLLVGIGGGALIVVILIILVFGIGVLGFLVKKK